MTSTNDFEAALAAAASHGPDLALTPAAVYAGLIGGAGSTAAAAFARDVARHEANLRDGELFVAALNSALDQGAATCRTVREYATTIPTDEAAS